MEAPSELWRSDAYRYEACGCNNFEQWPRDAATGLRDCKARELETVRH